MNSNLNHMNRVTNKMPSYIRRNLKNMPENKGYIIDGVYFYGHKPRTTSKIQLMFEKIDNDILRIHKTTDKYEILSEKNNKTGKVTILKKERRRKTIFKDILI